MFLGVNIDHIATLREVRKINEPDPLEALSIIKHAGAAQVTLHLREDRRHIHEFDVERIIESSFLPVNVECSTDKQIVDLLCDLRPHRVTLVPEKREEVTTEGGLDLMERYEILKSRIAQFKESEIAVSLFIDADLASIDLSRELGADMVELHTGQYANLHLMHCTNLPRTPNAIESLALDRASLKMRYEESLLSLKEAAKKAHSLGLMVAAGHGLNYQNVAEVARIPEISELNIGHSIMACSILLGLERAVSDMLALLKD